MMIKRLFCLVWLTVCSIGVGQTNAEDSNMIKKMVQDNKIRVDYAKEILLKIKEGENL